MTKIVNFQENKNIMDLLENDFMEIRKKAITLGRLPKDEEIGKEFPTYVSDDNGGAKLETSNIVSDDVVIARNPNPICENTYNEWLVPKETWEKNYGVEATDKFKEYQKQGTIKAIPITSEVLKELGSIDGVTAKIAVSWNDEGMDVYKGGVLTDQGYGIAPQELSDTYEVVKPNENAIDNALKSLQKPEKEKQSRKYQ